MDLCQVLAGEDFRFKRFFLKRRRTNAYGVKIRKKIIPAMMGLVIRCKKSPSKNQARLG